MVVRFVDIGVYHYLNLNVFYHEKCVL